MLLPFLRLGSEELIDGVNSTPTAVSKSTSMNLVYIILLDYAILVYILCVYFSELLGMLCKY